MEARMCCSSIYLGLLLLQMLFIASDAVSRCPISRDSIPADRKCMKSCRTDADCLSWKKTCECDGVCGRSCIKKKLKCNELTDIPNGRLVISPKNQFGAVAEYSCNNGYRLHGNHHARVCQGDEEWSGEQPRCVRDNTILEPECSDPPIVPNAVHNGAPGMRSFPHNTVLTYTCIKGTKLEHDSIINAICARTRKWLGPNMACRRIECPSLLNIQNGWVTQDTLSRVGSTATYYCKVGYVLSGQSERLCVDDGKWEGLEPNCGRVACGRPPTVKNAIHDGGVGQRLFPAGAQLTYACAYGYVSDGNTRAVCQESGDWTGLTLTCPPRRCGNPRAIEHGYMNLTTFTYQSKVTYHCYEGYQLIGLGYRMCQASGQWGSDVPYCEPVVCPTLFAPMNGRLMNFDNTFGTLVRFACNMGYKLFGSMNRTCQADRKWSGEKTKCVEIDCGWPGPFYNGQIFGENTTMGSELKFRCNVRATFDGMSTSAVCQDTGEWSYPPPICWGQCQVPHMENATLLEAVELAYVNHGGVMEFHCHHGLQPKAGHRVHCDNGTWSEVADCIPAPCLNTPPHVRNGMRIFLGQDHGFRAKYKCFAGYQLTGINTTYLTCEFGNWVGGKPECKEYYCPSPGTIKHGRVYKRGAHGRLFVFQPYIRMIKHGHQLEYKCERGYQIAGADGATCVNGRWQPPLPEPGKKCQLAIHPPFQKLWTPINNIRTS